METVKLSSKGRIVIPKEIREAQHFSVGTEFIVTFVGNEIRLKPVPVFTPTRVREVAGALAKPSRKPLGTKATSEAIGRMLMEVDEAGKNDCTRY